MIENLIEASDLSLLEQIKSTNNEILTIKNIIENSSEKGKYAYTDVLIPYLDILLVYHLYIKTGNEKYGGYAREKFEALTKELDFLRYEFHINNDFGIELLSDIDLTDITYLKGRASLLVALDYHNKNHVLDLPTKRDLFMLASYISDEEKAFAKREQNANPDALLCLVWALDKLWLEALHNNDDKRNEIYDEKKKHLALAYNLGHPLAALALSKAYKSPTDNERCKNYIMGAIGTIDGIRYLDSNKHDIYDFWAYKGLMEIRQEFYDAYVEKTEDFYLLSKCAKVACTDKYAEKISALILSTDDFSKLWGSDLIDIKKGLYWRRSKYNEAYKKVRDYLCEKGHQNSIYEKILDEIDEGINVEENFEKLYSFETEEARVLYDYKKNKRWNTYYFGSKHSDFAYPTCYREWQKGKPKDVESFYDGAFGKWSLNEVKK